jgi:hypothetical protein
MARCSVSWSMTDSMICRQRVSRRRASSEGCRCQLRRSTVNKAPAWSACAAVASAALLSPWSPIAVRSACAQQFLADRHGAEVGRCQDHVAGHPAQRRQHVQLVAEGRLLLSLGPCASGSLAMGMAISGFLPDTGASEDGAGATAGEGR